MKKSIGIGLSALIGLAALATPTAAEELAPTAPLPAPAQMTQWTNALMGSSDIATILPGGRVADKAMFSPPGGQDPLPICEGSSRKTASLDRGGAIGVQASARAATGSLYQVIYVYPDQATANAAWLSAHRQIDRFCSDATPGSVNSGSFASTLNQIDESIQMLWFEPEKGRVSGAQLAAMEAAAPLLAQRWAERATLPLTQAPLLTAAQASMLTEDDVPPELPVGSAQDGAWSFFDANAGPSTGPTTCRASDRITAGLVNFTVALGSSGDVLSIPGSISQSLSVYATRADAESAWREVRRSVASCTETPKAPIRPKTSVNRLTNGTAMEFQGVPGVWSRSFSAYAGVIGCSNSDGKKVPCPTFSAKSYAVSLLVGNAIQTVTYYTGRNGIGQMPLDQAAVNALAEELAGRWFAGAANLGS